MNDTRSKLQHKTWTRGEYLISTDPSLIPLTTLNEMFASDNVYWAKPMPESVWQDTLQNSLTFGLYHNTKQPEPTSKPDTAISPFESAHGLSDHKFIGLARCVTDFTTFLYLTDVYISPEFQGEGLGRWLITCIQEVTDSMPYLRRSMLLTGDWKRTVPFYEKLMGMSVAEGAWNSDRTDGNGLAVMMRKGPGAQN